MESLQLSPQAIAGITLLAIWELVWKGVALWKAGQNNDKLWFVLLLVFNTAGILPIVYIFSISKSRSKKTENQNQ